MSIIKNIAKKNFHYFFYFFSQLRYRIFYSIFLSTIVGVMDGFGLAMFIPMLQMVNSEKASNAPDNMGNLNFLIDGMNKMGISLTLNIILFVILIFFALKGVFKFIEGYVRVNNEQFFIRKVRSNYIYALTNYSYNDFVLADSGKIQNSISGEVEKVNQAYRYYFMTIQQITFVFVYIAMAFFSNPKFAILVSIGGGLSNIIFKKVYKTTKSLSKKITTNNHTFQGLLIQKVAFFKYLKATGLIKKYSKKLLETNAKIQASQRKNALLNNLTQAIKEPMIILVVVCVIILQVKFFNQGLGLIILSLLLFYRALIFLMSMQNYWNFFLNFSGSLDNMTSFYKELKAGKETDGKIEFEKFSDKIEIKNVSLNYKETSVLNNISLNIKKNETVAIIGESGSGKTTLINLLTGILTPTSGSIHVDNTDLKDYIKNTYQLRIGYITQEPVIFNDTIFNNVTFWDEPSPENIKRFEDAVKKASILEFINTQPQGRESLLGNNGINVSGGQKQRISIARELYKDVDFLFLDEATSALDSETEKTIQENIDQLKGKYTIIIVAHRLSTIKNANNIVLLNKGNIECTGAFSDLMNISASFKKMIELQAFD